MTYFCIDSVVSSLIEHMPESLPHERVTSSGVQYSLPLKNIHYILKPFSDRRDAPVFCGDRQGGHIGRTT